jgi:hypothetical protein
MSRPTVRIGTSRNRRSTDETVTLDAWLDTEVEMLYLSDESAAGRPSAGGYAIAAAFGGDARRISHDWVAAWSEPTTATAPSKSSRPLARRRGKEGT